MPSATPDEVGVWLVSARQRAKPKPEKSDDFLNLASPRKIAKFMEELARRRPRRMKRFLRDMQWIDEEGKKAGVW